MKILKLPRAFNAVVYLYIIRQPQLSAKEIKKLLVYMASEIISNRHIINHPFCVHSRIVVAYLQSCQDSNISVLQKYKKYVSLFLQFYCFILLTIIFTLNSKFNVDFGTGHRLVSESVPERTIHTFADVVVPFLLGTITIR